MKKLLKNPGILAGLLLLFSACSLDKFNLPEEEKLVVLMISPSDGSVVSPTTLVKGQVFTSRGLRSAQFFYQLTNDSTIEVVSGIPSGLDDVVTVSAQLTLSRKGIYKVWLKALSISNTVRLSEPVYLQVTQGVLVADTNIGNSSSSFSTSSSVSSVFSTSSASSNGSDQTAPVLTVTPPAGTYSNMVNLILSAVDTVDVHPTVFYTTNGTVPNVAYTGSVLLSSDTTVYATALDASGNQSTILTAVYKVIQDQEAPVLSLQTSSGTYTNELSVSFVVNDNADQNPRIYYTIDGSMPSTNASLYQGSILIQTNGTGNRSVTLKTIAVDASGNVSPVLTANYTLVEYKQLVFYMKNSSWLSANAYIWTDNGTVTKYNGDWPGNAMQDMGNGWFRVIIPNLDVCNIIFSQNASGQSADQTNKSSGWYDMDSDTWTTSDPDDSTPPDVTWLSPSDFATVAGNVNLSVSASDNNSVAKVSYEINGRSIGESSVLPFGLIWDSTADISTGQATLSAIAEDGAGNAATNTITIYGNNPAIAPIANAGGSKRVVLKDGSAMVNLDASASYDPDGNIVSYSWSDGSQSATGSTATFTYSTLGTNQVTLTVTDNDGSVGTDQIQVIVSDKADLSFFTWDNAMVYFVIPDRFYNGNTDNDKNYGRKVKDEYGSGAIAAGTFHGGDIKGLTVKLQEGYFTNLGVNAIWITAPYEQSHGWCGGGSDNDFPHYAYHGYYTLDWTMMDRNMGTIAEMREFVKTAHAQGIRVIMDIVMNHVGYNTLLDAVQYNFGGVNMTEAEAVNFTSGWDTLSAAFDYQNASAWIGWWSSDWIRAGSGGSIYDNADDSSDLTMNTSSLPDIKTEETGDKGVAPILQTKWAMETGSDYTNWINPSAANLRQDLHIAPAEYQIKWLAAWVREFGIDGFRVDTAKHVDKYRWGQLKAACKQALTDWRNDTSKMPDDIAKGWTNDFWMTGEVYGAGYGKADDYANNGFDSLINFNFPKDGNVNSIGSTWAEYAQYLNVTVGETWNTLSYLSSHDKGLSDRENMINEGTTLILSPGAVQIFYGDENARPWGDGSSTSDSMQGSRSDYVWGDHPDVLAHWQKLGQFRNRHFAIGAGIQSDLGNNFYVRTSTKGGVTDTVIIGVAQSGTVSVNVSAYFADGTLLCDAYTGNTATVSGGQVSFVADSHGVVLIEEE